MSSSFCASSRRIGASASRAISWAAGWRLPGSKLERFRELAPSPAQGKLTVSLWLGLKPVAIAKKKKTQSNVEVAA